MKCLQTDTKAQNPTYKPLSEALQSFRFGVRMRVTNITTNTN